MSCSSVLDPADAIDSACSEYFRDSRKFRVLRKESPKSTSAKAIHLPLPERLACSSAERLARRSAAPSFLRSAIREALPSTAVRAPSSLKEVARFLAVSSCVDARL